MLLQKIAVNATNSGAIDHDGNLYCWGSQKYGIAMEGDKPNPIGLPIDHPTKMPIKIREIEQYHGLKPIEADNVSIFTLLDPAEKSGQQVYTAQQISFGSYHAGVVCNDVSTPGPFQPLPGSQQSILEDFKKFLLRLWNSWEKSEHNDLLTQVKMQFQSYMEKSGEDRKHGGGEKLGVPSKFQDEDVTEQLKVEYALRLVTGSNEKETYPYITEKELKAMFNKARIRSKEEFVMTKLFTHFKLQALTTISKMEKAHRDLLLEHGKKEEFVNLKELRDHLMQRRCSNGILFMFGMANEGRLGVRDQQVEEAQDCDKTPHTFIKPMRLVRFDQVDNNVNIKKVQCGSSFAIALSETGSMYAWGFGKSGSLGLQGISNTHTPMRISQTHDGKNCPAMTDISTGSSHSLALDRNGKVYSWGNGLGFRLGHKQAVGENAPRQIKFDLQDKYVKFIEAGDACSACITTDHGVYVWGLGLNYRLGNGQDGPEPTPAFSNELEDKNVIFISMGTNSTFAVLVSGQLFAWGSSKSGKLGFELSNDKNYTLPKEVIQLEGICDVQQVAAGPFHTLVLSKDGKIFAMGNKKDGKLGLGPLPGGQDVDLPKLLMQNCPTFYCVQKVKDNEKIYPLFNEFDEYGKLKPLINKLYEVQQVACGDNFQIFLDNVGELWSCGSNKCGQLGICEADDAAGGEDGDDEVSGMVKTKKKDDAEELSAFIGGDLQTKLGKMTKQADKEEPVKIDFTKAIQQKNPIGFVACGGMHAIAVSVDKSCVVSWGKNANGQLGLGVKTGQIFTPTKIKTFTRENLVVQVACGESHSVFLTKASNVWTCGSNQFGQLGLSADAVFMDDNDQAQGGSDVHMTPVVIEKSVLDHVVYIAAGRYHTIAVRKQTEGDAMRMDDSDEDDSSSSDDQIVEPAIEMPDEDVDEKQVYVDIKHDVYSWGRGYHGQLGLRNLKTVQWIPKKVKIKRDPRFQESEQATRIANIKCGERHTIILAVNGNIWWSGEKTSVGLIDPNKVRKNMYDPAEEDVSYQYQFLPLPQGNVDDLQHLKFKTIAANFNSKVNFAITENNEPYIFGQNIPFQKVQSDNKRFIQAFVGKGFQTMIDNYRLPYTWGDSRNGKLGLKFETSKKLSKDNSKYVETATIVEKLKVELRDNAQLSEQQREEMDKKYNKKEDPDMHIQVPDDDEQKDFTLKFPVQKDLKQHDQEALEASLIQKDVDLIIEFKNEIEKFHDTHSQLETLVRKDQMNAQDSLISRILTFPKQLDPLDRVGDEDLDDYEHTSKLMINRQIYEVMFTLLQTHPCYLVNWITAYLQNKVNLFDNHPLAYLIDDGGDHDRFSKIKKQYMSLNDQNIMSDEMLYLVITIFGGMKMIYNNRRAATQIMNIGIRVFQFETANTKVDIKKGALLDYEFRDLIDCIGVSENARESTYERFHRLLFESQACNNNFTNKIFEAIVTLFIDNQGKYVDGNDKSMVENPDLLGEDVGKNIRPRNNLFDYQTEIINPGNCERRVENVVKFCTEVFNKVIIPMLTTFGMSSSKSNQNLSQEVIMMNLKAYEIMYDQAKKNNTIILKKKYPEKIEEENEKSREKIIQTILKCLFEKLIMKMQNLKPIDVINLPNVGFERYKQNYNLTVERKRNNFFHLANCMQAVFLNQPPQYSSQGGAIDFSPLQDFIIGKDKNWRREIWGTFTKSYSRDGDAYDTIMIQKCIEDAMESQNPVCPMMLRNIVYVHNQLVSYGDANIFIKGFGHDHKTPDDKDQKQNDDEEEKSEESGNGDSEEETIDMCPLKFIMEQLGNQFILLRIVGKEFVSQETLSKSVNLQIRIRTFETYNQVVRCNDCGCLVYEELLPKNRIKYGLEMNPWKCQHRDCLNFNSQPMSMICSNSQCQRPRPINTLPQDLMFPLYIPINTQEKINERTNKMERLLKTVPDIGHDEDDLAGYLSQEKDKQKSAENAKGEDKEEVGEVNRELISVIEDFMHMRKEYIEEQAELEKHMREMNTRAARNLPPVDESKKDQDDRYTRDLCDDLVARIKENMDRRNAHQRMINRNQTMIRECREKFQIQNVKIKQNIDLFKRFKDNCKNGMGSLNLTGLLNEKSAGKGIISGRLEELAKQVKLDQKKKEGKEEEKKVVDDGSLQNYFAKMKQKDEMRLNNVKAAKKRKEHQAARDNLRGQFAQFQSYEALKLAQDGTINPKVKVGKKGPDLSLCKYLFYEVAENPEDEQEGGYRIELSFEEKNTGFLFCAPFGSGGNNQSILSSEMLENKNLTEMRRLMGTKSKVVLGGTEYDIFQLCKLINELKTSNAAYDL